MDCLDAVHVQVNVFCVLCCSGRAVEAVERVRHVVQRRLEGPERQVRAAGLARLLPHAQPPLPRRPLRALPGIHVHIYYTGVLYMYSTAYLLCNQILSTSKYYVLLHRHTNISSTRKIRWL